MLEYHNNQLQTFDLLTIQNSDLNCDDDIFFETLLNNIRNEVTSYQHFIFKTRNHQKNELLKTYELIKNNADPDNQQLNAIETQLNAISESELADELCKYNIFDILNQEKITPAFLQLAKIGKCDATLDEICDETGNHFPTTNDRKQYITNYYREVYSARDDPPNIQTIENFLGPVVLANPVIANAKISADERTSFESELSLLELDKSIS